MSNAWACFMLVVYLVGVYRILSLNRTTSMKKECHYCQTDKGPWAVWRRALTEPGNCFHERIAGIGPHGRKHRLCKECHESMRALAKLDKERKKDGFLGWDNNG